jgi:hypothetical protein
MPIKFRCVYCEQLLGIARRKAGTVVKCPNCAGQLIVPAPDAADMSDESDKDDATAAAPELEAAGARQAMAVKQKPIDAGATEASLLFERNDFDELLRPVQENRPVVQPSNGHSKPAAAPAPDDFASMPPLIAPQPATKARKGILLTPVRLALLLVFVIAGFAFSFAGGLLIGKFVLGR